MKEETLSGSCLCGAVTFTIKNEFDHFQLCHCEQCQKATGTAHASKLFTRPEYISWQSGQDAVVRYDVPGRRISNVFCPQCGARMPWLSLSGDVLAVPAGSLNGTPSIAPRATIFWPERAAWYDEGLGAQRYDTFAQ